jgi:hypothetical protein
VARLAEESGDQRDQQRPQRRRLVGGTETSERVMSADESSGDRQRCDERGGGLPGIEDAERQYQPQTEELASSAASAIVLVAAKLPLREVRGSRQEPMTCELDSINGKTTRPRAPRPNIVTISRRGAAAAHVR